MQLTIPDMAETSEATVSVKPSKEEDWMTFVEEQSTLRAELAMALDYDSDDREGRYRAPEAFLKIGQIERDVAGWRSCAKASHCEIW